jgi:hypothetical protein
VIAKDQILGTRIDSLESDFEFFVDDLSGTDRSTVDQRPGWRTPENSAHACLSHPILELRTRITGDILRRRGDSDTRRKLRRRGGYRDWFGFNFGGRAGGSSLEVTVSTRSFSLSLAAAIVAFAFSIARAGTVDSSLSVVEGVDGRFGTSATGAGVFGAASFRYTNQAPINTKNKRATVRTFRTDEPCPGDFSAASVTNRGTDGFETGFGRGGVVPEMATVAGMGGGWLALGATAGETAAPTLSGSGGAKSGGGGA